MIEKVSTTCPKSAPHPHQDAASRHHHGADSKDQVSLGQTVRIVGIKSDGNDKLGDGLAELLKEFLSWHFSMPIPIFIFQLILIIFVVLMTKEVLHPPINVHAWDPQVNPKDCKSVSPGELDQEG